MISCSDLSLCDFFVLYRPFRYSMFTYFSSTFQIYIALDFILPYSPSHVINISKLFIFGI
jgi:hypothetical protein